MTIVAASGLAGSLWVLVAIACPLMMIFMMRGMRGGDHAAGEPPKPLAGMSLEELKHERDVLNEEIGQRAEGGSSSPNRNTL